MSLAEPCCTASLKLMRTLLRSFPNGTPAPRSTECITTLPTPKSLPTVELIRVVLCQRVDSQQLLTLYSVQSWHSFARITTQAPNSLPTLTIGTCGSNRNASCRQLLLSQQPPDQLMSTTQSPDTDSLFRSTPLLRPQLAQLQSTLSQQMNKPSFQLKPLGAALRLQTTQKKQVSIIQRNIHRQFYNSLTDTPTEQAILLSQSTSHTGAHLMQPSSEAYEIEDRCFRVSVARRLMLPHPAAANPADVVQSCPNKSAAGVICNKPLDPKQHRCYGCLYGGGVDRRHAALARCLADIIHSHSGVKVFIEQEVPALTRVVNGQTEHARMDLVFNLNGSITYLDVSIVAPFSCNPSLVSAASTKPGFMAKRAEKTKFDRYPHINLVPFILETTGRPGPHARKFINYFLRDADNPPIAVRDTWSTIQSVLHSAISKQQLTAAVT